MADVTPKAPAWTEYIEVVLPYMRANPSASYNDIVREFGISEMVARSARLYCLGVISAPSAGVEEVPLDNIYIPDDLLRGLDPVLVTVDDIAPSIREYGALHPILVRSVTDPEEIKFGVQQYILLAGYRRLKAHRVVGRPTIRIRVLDNLTIEQQTEIELLENSARQSLPPHREAHAILNLLTYRTGLERGDAASACYKIVNHAKGLVNTSATSEVEEKIRLTFSVLGRSLTSFVTDLLPTVNWKPDLLLALEAGTLSTRQARALNRIESPELRGDAVRLVSEGVPPVEARKRVLEQASFDKRVVNDTQDAADLFEGYKLREGRLWGTTPLVDPEPTMGEAVSRADVVQEIIIRKRWMGEEITMLFPTKADIIAALQVGCRVRWIDASAHTNSVHQIGNVELDERTIAFAELGTRRSEAMGDPTDHDPSMWEVEDTIAWHNQMQHTLVTRIQDAHKFSRPIAFCAVESISRAYAVLL